MVLLRSLLVNGQRSVVYVTDCSLQPRHFIKVLYDINISLDHYLSLSIQTTLKHAKNRPKRSYMLGTTRSLSISPSSIPSRTCEPTTSTCFMFIGGIGILASKNSWVHSITLFSKAKFYIWYFHWHFFDELRQLVK